MHNCLTRACSGWIQHSSNHLKILSTAEAQSVMPLDLRNGVFAMNSWEVVRFIHRIGSPIKAMVSGFDEYGRVLLETGTDYKSILTADSVEDARSQQLLEIGEELDTVVFNCVDEILYLSSRAIDVSDQSVEEWQAYYEFIDTLELGVEARGVVASSKAFGIFVDIGAPYIGLIDVGHDRFNEGDRLPDDMSIWPSAGESIDCRVSYFRLHNRQIGLGRIAPCHDDA
jgi:ribosomal protein S1